MCPLRGTKRCRMSYTFITSYTHVLVVHSSEDMKLLGSVKYVCIAIYSMG